MLSDHHRVVGPVIRSRGGRIVKRLGDGLLLSFPSSEAAVYACLELLPSAPESLRLRAGVHCGEVVVTRDDVIGHVVNIAARVADSAKGDEVLVTAQVRDAVGELPGITFTRPRKRTFKGLDEPIAVCKASEADSALRSPRRRS
jgi:adenylate cyclase